MQYHDLFQKSFILHRYLRQGAPLLDDYDVLMKDIFLLLYKMVLNLQPNTSGNTDLGINYELLLRLKKTHRVGKLRGRTKGNTAATYIALKYLLDGILDHARGKVNMRALQDKIQYKHQLETELQLEYLKALIQSHNATVLLTDEEINLIKTLVKKTHKILKGPLKTFSNLLFLS